MDKRHDVVIPLGIKSYENNNFEIRVAVASIKKYFKCLKRIIIVSQIEPIKELGNDIIWVYQDDIYTHDKDANIIEKVRKAIETIPDLTDDFIMWSDDQFHNKGHILGGHCSQIYEDIQSIYPSMVCATGKVKNMV